MQYIQGNAKCPGTLTWRETMETKKFVHTLVLIHTLKDQFTQRLSCAGDKIKFEYTGTNHNVIELTKEKYDNCEVHLCVILHN